MKIKATKAKDAMRYKLHNRRVLVQKIEDNQYKIRLIRLLSKDFADLDSIRDGQSVIELRNRKILITTFRLTEEALECITHAYKDLNK